jgi:hypothetical protein
MQIVATQPIDITEMEMTVTAGGVSVQVFEADDGTASGTFTELPVQSTNLRAPKTPSFTVSGGGAFVPSGQAIGRMSVSTDTNLLSNTRSRQGRLSLPAGTYFVVTGLISGVASFTGELIIRIAEVIEP